MERGTITTLDKLKQGDRFYKAADKGKAVWKVEEVMFDRFSKATCVKVAKQSKWGFEEPVAKKNPEQMQVIFLRSSNSPLGVGSSSII